MSVSLSKFRAWLNFATNLMKCYINLSNLPNLPTPNLSPHPSGCEA
ncbi:hypothetical protein [Campylobacter troglodytis]|nr:hypothetical protein [Campylobacter troglodytis]